MTKNRTLFNAATGLLKAIKREKEIKKNILKNN
jgi:hypothetical protein